MKISAPGKVMRLIDVPAGGLVGFFEDGRYVRCLRTASVTTAQDHVAIVGVGPFLDDRQPDRVQGPTSYMWQADVEVIYEDQTSLVPIHDSAVDPSKLRHMELGTIVLTKSGQVGIYSRTPRAGRALIDLSNGELIRDENAVALYKHYLLVAPDEMQKLRAIFDSSKQVSAIPTAA